MSLTADVILKRVINKHTCRRIGNKFTQSQAKKVHSIKVYFS